ncbi:Coenzyme F420 hydrogenase/dehydrogenase, beta subunit C-terminal domain [Priestia megaterium]|uniref:Coenzyme F420 hydrogenase/dehydrogenase, beta subunit C-terminal domain n=1 Tax=Priestia megaterium TaxID=1404 RepID=UPI0011A0860D|nr:Coenzyme F420 hydrogenase/dehydrogenase, beta subunit C-terminal domain [Priestia megaterium]
MSFLSLKDEIIDEDLCTSCGMCVPACPDNLISISKQDVPLPQFSYELNKALDVCGSCNLCLEVCPGFDTGAVESDKRIFGRERKVEERWTGIYKKSYQLTTKNPEILSKVAAGGAGTILSITALEENYVDAMLVIGRDQEKPWMPKAFLTDSVEKIIECSQSSYCITPNLDLLNNTEFKKIGIVGVPCQIQAVNKVLNNKHNKDLSSLANKLAFTMEIACASNTSISGTEHLIANILNVELNKVEEMKYREGEYPGQFYVRTKDQEEHYLPFYRLVEEFKKHKTYRCLTCPDWWSGLSDISISDGDPNIFETSRDGGDIKPSSTVMVRTDLGEELIKLAFEKGYINLTDYDFYNNLGLERKRQRYNNYRLNSEKRVPLPSGPDENISELLSDNEVIEKGILRR